MIQPFVRHLVESSAFASVMLVIASQLRRQSASLRFSLLLAAIAKFGIPLQGVVLLGENLRDVFPRAPVFFAAHVVSRVYMPTLPAQNASSGFPLGAILTAIWLGCSLLLLARWAKQLAAAAPVSIESSAEDSEVLHRLEPLIPSKRKVQLAISYADLEPRLIGIRRATILLPPDLSKRLTPLEFEAVLLHELAHARRRDNLTRSLARVVACFFWFHPLLWFLEKRLGAECELACDEMVLAAGASPEAYLSGIVKVCQSYLLHPLPGLSNMNSSNLKQRMESIMAGRTSHTVPAPLRAIGSLSLATLTVAALGTGFNLNRYADAQVDSPRSAQTTNSCVIADKHYPEGTVVRNGTLKVCRIVKAQPKWVATTEQLRDTRKAVIEIPNPAAVMCKVTAPQGKFCTCEDRIFSPGALVDSEKGTLACPASGGRWQRFKGKQTPWPPLVSASR